MKNFVHILNPRTHLQKRSHTKLQIQKYFLLLLFVIHGSLFTVFAQQNSNGYNKFYFQNGNISSEGNMVNGKPDGYWKSYYENGQLKSEGNRVNLKLEGPWKFYNEKGVLASE